MDNHSATSYVTHNGKPVPVYYKLPEGWRILEGTTTEPRGYRWIDNKTSFFSKEHQLALLKID